MDDGYDDISVGLSDNVLQSLSVINISLVDMVQLTEVFGESFMDFTILLQNGNSALGDLTKSAVRLASVLEKINLPAGTGSQSSTAVGDGFSPLPAVNIPDFPKSIGGAISSAMTGAMQESLIVAQLKAAGFSDSDIKAAVKTAQDEQVNIPGTSLNGNLNTIYNAHKYIENAAQTNSDLPSLLKSAIRAAGTNGSEQDVDDTAYNMAGFDKLSDYLIDPKTHKVNQQIADVLNNGMANALLASGGTVNAADFYKMASKVEHPVMDQMTNAVSFAAIAPVIMALKGEGVGASPSALGGVFGSHDMGKSEEEKLRGIGISPESLAQIKSPAQWADWFETRLIPALASHGYKNPAAQQAYIKTMLNGVKGADALGKLLKNFEKIEDYSTNYRSVAGDPQQSYDYILQNNLPLKLNAFSAALQSFLQAFGNAALPPVIVMLNDMTKALDKLGQSAADHPGASEAVDGVIAGIIGATALKGIAGKLKGLLGLAGDAGGCSCASKLPDPCETKCVKSMNEVTSVLTKVLGAMGLGGMAMLATGEAPKAVPVAARLKHDLITLFDDMLDVSAGKGPAFTARFPDMGGGNQPRVGDYRQKWDAFVTGGEKSFKQTEKNLPSGAALEAESEGLLAALMASLMAELMATMSSGAAFASATPMPVVVMNPQDIHGGTARYLTSQAGVQTGPTGFDYTHGLLAPTGAYL